MIIEPDRGALPAQIKPLRPRSERMLNYDWLDTISAASLARLAVHESAPVPTPHYETKKSTINSSALSEQSAATKQQKSFQEKLLLFHR
jgi:hypothetical protein